MPKVRALTGEQARRSLASRLSPIADKLRQIAVDKGLRPYRVALVWTKFGGEAEGEGTEREVKRVEILPTPKVVNLDSITFNQFHPGMFPIGSIRVERVSASFSDDLLRGLVVPSPEDLVPQPWTFSYEVFLDGRHEGQPPQRWRFRLLSQPFLQPGKEGWTLMLARVNADPNRAGESLFG